MLGPWPTDGPRHEPLEWVAGFLGERWRSRVAQPNLHSCSEAGATQVGSRSYHRLSRASQRNEVVTLGRERFPLKPTVDALDLEARQPEHQLHLSAPDHADDEFMHPLVLKPPLSVVQLVEEAHRKE